MSWYFPHFAGPPGCRGGAAPVIYRTFASFLSWNAGISHVLRGPGGAAPVIYKGFALRLCLGRLKLPRFAGPRRGQSCHLAGICFATLLRSGWRYMIHGNSISATSKHIFGAIAAYTCIGLARARDGAFLLGVSRGICIPNAAQQQY